MDVVSGPSEITTGTYEVTVRVTNETGHKVPSGYPDGRRVWVNLEVSDGGSLVYESGHYDEATARLTAGSGVAMYARATTTTIDTSGGNLADNRVMVYEKITGSDPEPDGIWNESPALLNSEVLFDNRIPPKGWDPTSYEEAGIYFRTYDESSTGVVWRDDPDRFATGQNWDDITYVFDAPTGATLSARAELNMQTHSREFVEYLKDNQPADTPRPEGPPSVFSLNYPLEPTYLADQVDLGSMTDLDGQPLDDNWGGIAYAGWLLTGKGSPELMDSAQTGQLPPPAVASVEATGADPFSNLVSWTPVAEAEGYDVYVRYGTSNLWAAWDKVISVPSSATTSYFHDGLNVGKTYAYKVVAWNGAGESGMSNTAVATTPSDLPIMPEHLKVIGTTANTVSLAWYDNADDETGFIIQRQDVPVTADFVTIDTVPSQTPGGTTGGNTYVDTTAMPASVYNYRIAAYNDTGASIWTIPVMASTLKPPSTPSTFTASATATDTIHLSWEESPGVVDGYRLERAPASYGPFVEVADLTTGTVSYDDTPLSDNTPYFYRLYAYNSAGDSPAATATATTPLAPPGIPGGFAASATTTDTIELSWTTSSGTLDGYRLGRSTVPTGPYSHVATLTAGDVMYSDAGLSDDTPYYYELIAYNTAGDSPTATAMATTPLAVPGLPGGFAASAAATDTINLLWTTASGAVDGYTLERSMWPAGPYSHVATLTPAHVAYADTGLADNTDYYYRLSAFNTAGDGPAATASATTLLAVPGTPASFEAVATGIDAIKLTWGSTTGLVADYHLLRATAPGGTYTTVTVLSPGVFSYTDAPLADNTPYYYRLYARNASGVGLPAEASATTSLAVPGVAASFTATATSTSSIQLDWTSASGVVTGYRIKRSLSATGTFLEVADVTSATATYTDMLLADDTTYHYKLYAYNTSGAGPAADASATTPLAVPGTPVALAASATATDTVKLTWLTSAGTLDGYRLGRSTMPTGPYSHVATLTAGNVMYSDTGLSDDTPYYYELIAYNAAGDSPAATATATTPLAVPGVAASFTATATSTSSIQLDWTSASGVVTGYRIKRSLSATGTFLEVADVTSATATYTDMLLADDTTYHYKLYAYNTSGAGPAADASATTPLAVPGTPVALAASATATDTVKLTWLTSAGTLDGYRLGRSTMPTGPYSHVATLTAGNVMYSDTGLSDDTPYYYELIAYNAAGDSPAATATATTPLAVPGVAASFTATATSTSSIQLDWTSASGVVTGYRIKRSLSATGTFLEVADVTSATATYTDMLLADDTTYHYKLYAYNTSGAGPAADASATTPLAVPGTPVGFSPSSITPSGVGLTWGPASGEVSGYRLERTTSPGGPYQVVAVLGSGATTYSDATVQNTTTYYYKLYAYNAAGDGPPATTFLITPAINLKRISGSDRYATAVNAAKEAFPNWAGVTDVIVASGEDAAQADALSASGLAGAYNAPLLLASKNSVPSSTRSAIDAMPDGVQVHVIGGPATISNSTLSALGSIAGVGGTERVSGSDRYATAAAVATRMKAVLGGAFPSSALIVNGQNPDKFWDALSASPVATEMHYPILLVMNNSVPSATRGTISSLGITRTFIVGGPATVPNSVATQLGTATGDRIYGSDRYATAVAVASRAKSEGWLEYKHVGVAGALPDALTGGVTLGTMGGPIVITQSTSLPSATRGFLQTNSGAMNEVLVLGGPASVSSGVYDAIGAALD